ncbi:hypothetical protein [Legionella micdadei]|uniref:Putative secreted protein n=1 Tax=Legionella micdadei TaxID=451 RepID=A0A098GC89_LEGMI|nr:hypothetical protein [Legionella micdadei]KTD30000.1 hypothetical protein Lmic_0435 [Legionella micdadei]CEG60118.1 putative secreted protein [Legionella micdadei]SCY65225.1 hypothetical protein SAMN02982997_02389 [Legionella micdadei]
MTNLHTIVKFFFGLSIFFLGLFYQPFCLAHTNEMHRHSRIVGKNDQPSIKMSVERIVSGRGKDLVFVKLTEIGTNKPIHLQDLNEVHTQKIHMLIIDDSLSDYSHVHPVATEEPGVYQFSWKPKKKDANYRIWADLVPVNTMKQEYIIADLYKSKSNFAQIIPRITTESVVGGYKFKLSFDKPKLELGKATMGKIDITDAQGNPVHNLEPIMGAYAHIVGFSDDFNTVMHVHPMGTEPSQATDRGGPELNFHIEPQKAGAIKLFAQVKIDGKELFVPFSYYASVG